MTRTATETATDELYEGGLVMLMASDFDRTFRFYTEGLGFQVKYRAGSDWAEITAGDISIGLHGWQEAPSAEESPGRISIGLRVQDLEMAVGRLRENGVQFQGEIEEDAAVRIANFHDPDGTRLYLYEERGG